MQLLTVNEASVRIDAAAGHNIAALVLLAPKRLGVRHPVTSAHGLPKGFFFVLASTHPQSPMLGYSESCRTLIVLFQHIGIVHGHYIDNHLSLGWETRRSRWRSDTGILRAAARHCQRHHSSGDAERENSDVAAERIRRTVVGERDAARRLLH